MKDLTKTIIRTVDQITKKCELDGLPSVTEGTITFDMIERDNRTARHHFRCL